MRFQLQYFYYKLLQDYVHCDYYRTKAILAREYGVHVANQAVPDSSDRASVLELGCGDGNLASVFPASRVLRDGRDRRANCGGKIATSAI